MGPLTVPKPSPVPGAANNEAKTVISEKTEKAKQGVRVLGISSRKVVDVQASIDQVISELNAENKTVISVSTTYDNGIGWWSITLIWKKD